jgi:hypothetical protein
MSTTINHKEVKKLMATSDVEKMQLRLDEAFASFREQHPDVAEAIRVLNIPYAEYLRILSGLNPELHSMSGNIFS